MPLPDTTVEAITRKIEHQNHRISAIREDATLSDLGKHQAIAAVHAETSREVDELRATAGTSTAARRKNLEARLFGTAGTDPYALIAMRDARDRVAQAAQAGGPAAVRDLVESSIGDGFIARAAFTAAVRGSRDLVGGPAWESIVEGYLAEHPEYTDDLGELEQLSSSASRTADFAERMATSVPLPAELQQRGYRSDEVPMKPAQFADNVPAGPAWRE